MIQKFVRHNYQFKTTVRIKISKLNESTFHHRFYIREHFILSSLTSKNHSQQPRFPLQKQLHESWQDVRVVFSFDRTCCRRWCTRILFAVPWICHQSEVAACAHSSCTFLCIYKRRWSSSRLSSDRGFACAVEVCMWSEILSRTNGSRVSFRPCVWLSATTGSCS